MRASASLKKGKNLSKEKFMINIYKLKDMKWLTDMHILIKKLKDKVRLIRMKKGSSFIS